MAFDVGVEGKPPVLDFTTLTLDEWLQDNSYIFLKNALSQHLGVETLHDIRIVSTNDIRDFFDSLKSQNSEILTAMPLPKRIQFKRAFLKLASDYSEYLNNLQCNEYDGGGMIPNGIIIEPGNELNNGESGTDSGSAVVLPRWEETLALEDLAVNCQETNKYMNQFKYDIQTLTSNFEKRKEELWKEYETLLQLIEKHKYNLEKELELVYDNKLKKLKEQLNMLSKHLSMNKDCEKECRDLIVQMSENSKISERIDCIRTKCRNCTNQTPKIYKISVDLQWIHSNNVNGNQGNDKNKEIENNSKKKKNNDKKNKFEIIDDNMKEYFSKLKWDKEEKAICFERFDPVLSRARWHGQNGNHHSISAASSPQNMHLSMFSPRNNCRFPIPKRMMNNPNGEMKQNKGKKKNESDAKSSNNHDKNGMDEQMVINDKSINIGGAGAAGQEAEKIEGGAESIAQEKGKARGAMNGKKKYVPPHLRGNEENGQHGNDNGTNKNEMIVKKEKEKQVNKEQKNDDNNNGDNNDDENEENDKYNRENDKDYENDENESNDENNNGKNEKNEKKENNEKDDGKVENENENENENKNLPDKLIIKYKLRYGNEQVKRSWTFMNNENFNDYTFDHLLSKAKKAVKSTKITGKKKAKSFKFIAANEQAIENDDHFIKFCAMSDDPENVRIQIIIS